MIHPTNHHVKILIELVFNKPNLFPLNKTQLLEYASLKFFKEFDTLFEDIKPEHQLSKDYMIIKNNINQEEFKIPKHVFNLYCGIHTLITDCNENINIIVVPFEFNADSAIYFCEFLLDNEFIDNIDEMREIDFNQFKQLIAYLQINIK